MELLGGNKNYSIAANREVQSERIMCEAILLDCEDSWGRKYVMMIRNTNVKGEMMIIVREPVIGDNEAVWKLVVSNQTMIRDIEDERIY